MKKSWKIVFAIFGYILVIVATLLIYNKYKKTSPIENSMITSPTTQPSIAINEYSGVTAKTPSIVFATTDVSSQNGYFKWINHLYEIGNSKSNTKEIKTSNYLLSSGYESSSSDNPVQWSADGKTFAYSFADEGGMDAPASVNSYNLVVVKNGISETIISHLEAFQVPKFLITPDDKSVIYIKTDETKEEGAKYSLYSYDITNKNTVILDADITDYARSSPMYLSGDNTSIYILRNKYDLDKNLYQYKINLFTKNKTENIILEGVDKNSAFMGSFSDSDASISPSGKLVAYRYQLSANKTAVGIYDMVSKNSTEVFAGEEKRSVNNVVWSPNERSIAFETTFFGTGSIPDDEYLHLFKIDVATKDQKLVDQSTKSSSNVGFLTTLGFSPDNNKLAYNKERKIMYYDFNKNESVEVYNLSKQDIVKAFGWVGF